MVQSALICLASQSPRRRELLLQIGVNHRVVPVHVDEAVLPDETAAAYVARLAKAKAVAGWRAQAPEHRLPVLGADTAVILDGHILGKPRDQVHAVEMLRSLSGRTHQVLTAVALACPGVEIRTSTSHVTFRTLEQAECVAYWQTGEPADKAGGYAIQGVAAQFITHLDGSYSGVMGLPLYETAQLLAGCGIVLLAAVPGAAVPG